MILLSPRTLAHHIPAESRRLSLLYGSINWIPMGSPRGPVVTGKYRHATPKKVQARLKIELPLVSMPFGASPGAPGVSRISPTSNILDKLSREYFNRPSSFS